MTQQTFKGFDATAYRVLAISSLRKLIPQRHCARWGKEARDSIRQWMNDLRSMAT